MIIKNIRKQFTKDKVALVADIQDKSGTFTMFFRVDKKHAQYIVQDTSPFLAATLISAIKKEEDIEIQGSVSKKLWQGASRICDRFIDWNIGQVKINVSASSLFEDTYINDSVGCFFSGGIDSFYTCTKKDLPKKINTMILVHGFDIDINDSALFISVFTRLKKVAKKMGCNLVVVETNLRKFTNARISWDLSCGSAMGSVALFLRKKLKKVYFSGGMEWAALRASGIHPHVDPFWSTETLSIEHVGCEARRIDKIKIIATNPLARQTLRVCWKNPRNMYNCCECEKCLRTMIGFHAIGALEKFTTFPKPINLSRLRSTYIKKNHIRLFQESLDILKQDASKGELVDGLTECIRRNKENKFLFSPISCIKQFIADRDMEWLGGSLYYHLRKRALV